MIFPEDQSAMSLVTPTLEPDRTPDDVQALKLQRRQTRQTPII